MPQEEDLAPSILFHLYRRKLWGASYTSKEKALSKIPKRLRGDGLEGNRGPCQTGTPPRTQRRGAE